MPTGRCHSLSLGFNVCPASIALHLNLSCFPKTFRPSHVKDRKNHNPSLVLYCQQRSHPLCSESLGSQSSVKSHWSHPHTHTNHTPTAVFIQRTVGDVIGELDENDLTPTPLQQLLPLLQELNLNMTTYRVDAEFFWLRTDCGCRRV